MTADGRRVIFSSLATDLTDDTPDTNGFYDIFIADRDPDENGVLDDVPQVITRITPPDSDGDSRNPVFSSDGRVFAFESDATNVASPYNYPPDMNGHRDIYVGGGSWNNADGPRAATSGNGDNREPSLSMQNYPEGVLLAFTSDATNLGVTDLNGRSDVYLDRAWFAPGGEELVSLDASGGQIRRDSYASAISGDGRRVAFVTDAGFAAGDSATCPGFVDPTGRIHADLGRSGGCPDVYLRDLATGDITWLSTDASGKPADGPTFEVAFAQEAGVIAVSSEASNLLPAGGSVPLDVNGLSDVYRLAFQGGFGSRPDVSLVSVSTEGRSGDLASREAAVSADGNVVAFTSSATDLVGPLDGDEDTDGVPDVYLRDALGAYTERISLGPANQEPDATSSSPTVSRDGVDVAFGSASATFHGADYNEGNDVFVRNRRMCASPNRPNGPVSRPVAGHERDGLPPRVAELRDDFLLFNLEDLYVRWVTVMADDAAHQFDGDPPPGITEMAEAFDALVALMTSLPTHEPTSGVTTLVQLTGDDVLEIYQESWDAFVAEFGAEYESLRPYLDIAFDYVLASGPASDAAPNRGASVAHDVNCTVVTPLEDGRIPQLPALP